MAKKLTHIGFADDDSDDHLLFSSALKEVDETIALSAFYHCDKMVDFLNDEQAPLPDIIFLDLNMPGNDGNKCLIMLKKTARVLHIPVIIYTTSDNASDREKAYTTGAFKYIVKPPSFTAIREMLREVITEFESND